MPLHDKLLARPALDAENYGTCATHVFVPRYKLGQFGLRHSVAPASVRDELFLADLWHSPEAANSIACSTTGSSGIGRVLRASIEKYSRQYRATRPIPPAAELVQ